MIHVAHCTVARSWDVRKTLMLRLLCALASVTCNLFASFACFPYVAALFSSALCLQQPLFGDSQQAYILPHIAAVPDRPCVTAEPQRGHDDKD